jgi:NAD(P)-dependent dehydrogenase (short-subunit alcohol dehydrogenase family)
VTEAQELAKRGAIVTGASRGIGRGIATILAERGACVVDNDVHPDTARATADAITRDGRTCIASAADISCEADVDRLFDAAVEAFRTPRISGQ